MRATTAHSLGAMQAMECSFSTIWTLSFNSSRIQTWRLRQHSWCSRLPSWVRDSIGQSVRGLRGSHWSPLICSHQLSVTNDLENRIPKLLRTQHSTWAYSITRTWLDLASSVLPHLAQFKIGSVTPVQKEAQLDQNSYYQSLNLSRQKIKKGPCA